MRHEENNSVWYDSIEDVKPEFISVKAVSLLSLFRLKGRTSTITTDNLEPLLPLKYLLHSPQENKFYLKDYKGYTLKELMDAVYAGSEPTINSLVNYVYDGNIYLMFDKEGISDMTQMLCRIYNAHFTDKGKLNYSDYIKLVKEITDYEYYQSYGKNLTGAKTVSNQLQLSIDELWNNAYKSKR